MEKITIIRLPALKRRMSESTATIYRRVQSRLITRQIRIGPRSVGWPEHEIDAILAARVAGKNDEEIREIVTSLEASRRIAA